jgi:Surface antigen variable number repeat
MDRRLTSSWLGLIFLLAGPPLLRAQSPATSGRCSSPAPAVKEGTAESTGQKVLPKVVVDAVVFEGSMSLPASFHDQLVAEIKQRDYAAGTEWLEELNEVAIRGAWQEQGFFKMTSAVKAQAISEDAAEQHVSVTVHVDEGIQYRLSEIRFRKAPDVASVGADDNRTEADEPAKGSRSILRRKITAADAEQPEAGEPAFPLEELRKSIVLSDGDLFRTTPMREGFDALKHLYGSHGYIEFVATPITEVDDGSGTILVIMDLSEGRQYRVRKIDVQGLDSRTEGNLKWRIQPGDLFNNELFEDFFVDNKDVLPAGASPRNAVLTKNRKNGTVDLRVVLQTCR